MKTPANDPTPKDITLNVAAYLIDGLWPVIHYTAAGAVDYRKIIESRWPGVTDEQYARAKEIAIPLMRAQAENEGEEADALEVEGRPQH